MLRSAVCLNAAVKYNIRRWFKPAARQLLGTPLSTLSVNDSELLAGPLLVDLLVHRRDIERIRARILNRRPFYVRSNVCTSQGQCRAVWEDMWDRYREQYASILDWELPLKEIHDTIEQLLTQPVGICPLCYSMSITPVIQGKHFLGEHNAIVAAAREMYTKHMVLKQAEPRYLPVDGSVEDSDYSSDSGDELL